MSVKVDDVISYRLFAIIILSQIFFFLFLFFFVFLRKRKMNSDFLLLFFLVKVQLFVTSIFCFRAKQTNDEEGNFARSRLRDTIVSK